MDPARVVRDFCETVARLDLEALIGFFTEDAVYHNIPMEPVRGHAEIKSTLAQFMSPGGEASFDITALAVDGNKVLTERVDILSMGGRRIEIGVMGVFEITPEGKISAWRDYFDLNTFMQQMA